MTVEILHSFLPATSMLFTVFKLLYESFFPFTADTNIQIVVDIFVSVNGKSTLENERCHVDIHITFLFHNLDFMDIDFCFFSLLSTVMEVLANALN